MSALAAKTGTANKLYTYADYYNWGEDAERCELIDGVVYGMSAPTIAHQNVVLGLGAELRSFFKGRRCRPFISPVDVRLFPKGLDDTVVQPDVIVVCDPKKFSDGKAIQGAPDLVVEVLSRSTYKHDNKRKFQKYEQAGVREYWIVDPLYWQVYVYILKDNKFTRFGVFDESDEAISSHIFEGLAIKPSDIFEEEQAESETEGEQN
ncbi:MAG: Uma2 family endonuclease [Defluviitaleaceae bacterium]|nr:Uma2 family endonuclease [Defluviitaleaceae bacterium]MCL2263477.1 Uma2 family endonuclease [Defluviitaleaceae bacterium]